MFRALWIKQWAQLRVLRWAGFGIGLLLPFFLWAGAAAARRGWLPFALGNFSLQTLFAEAQPLFSAFLWPLLALLFTGQSVAGDRADGTDRFLAERPVPPARIWAARLLASIASILVVIAASTFYNLALVALVVGEAHAGTFLAILQVVAIGTGLALVATIGAMAAGEMVRTPMQAAGLGVVLAALPILLPLFLSSVFSLVKIGGLHLSYLLAPILPAALLFGSYRSGCLGEPAGRGRVVRGVAIIGSALVLTPLLFAAATPFALRMSVEHQWPTQAAGNFDRIAILGGEYSRLRGWIVDTTTRHKVRFLPPPVQEVKWNAEGTMLAVVHRWGALGSVGRRRLELLDEAGRSIGRFDLDGDAFIRQLFWAGDRLLLTEQLSPRESRIHVFHRDRGRLGAIQVPGGFHGRGLIGPTDDGSVYAHFLIGQDPRLYVMQRLDFEAFELEAPVLTEEGDLPTYASKSLSPSGRYWVRTVREAKTSRRSSWIVDLSTLQRIEYPDSVFGGWLSGDRWVRVEEDSAGFRLVIQAGDGAELQTRSFEQAVGISVSPDRERLLVTRWTGEGDAFWFFRGQAIVRGGAVDRFWILDGGEWTELESLAETLDGHERYLGWAGPAQLIAYGHRSVHVADAVPGARWLPLLGGD